MSEREPCPPELLAPGGSIEKCRIALLYGADAIYAGDRRFGLRAFARNLSREELATACFLAHRLNKKLYVTINIFARNDDLQGLPAYLEYLDEIAADGLIISDPGVLMLARRHAPRIPVHLSTQANTTNAASVQFWKDQGVSRINLARELEFHEVEQIRHGSSVELELFVHGSMCVSYSGRCLLSAVLNDRSANLGRCSQPCRWSYQLVEEKRPGELYPIGEDARGTYIFNAKDLCLIEDLGKLMELGIDAFKVEGRMKGALYLASVLRTYRQAIDRHWRSPAHYTSDPEWLRDLQRLSRRPYTRAPLFGGTAERADDAVSASVAHRQYHCLAALVRPDPQQLQGDDAPSDEIHPSWTCIEVRSRLVKGQAIEFLNRDGTSIPWRVDGIEDLCGNQLHCAHPNSWIRLPLPFPTFPLQVIATLAEPPTGP